jgi:hypothetical protein
MKVGGGLLAFAPTGGLAGQLGLPIAARLLLEAGGAGHPRGSAGSQCVLALLLARLLPLPLGRLACYTRVPPARPQRKPTRLTLRESLAPHIPTLLTQLPPILHGLTRLRARHELYVRILRVRAPSSVERAPYLQYSRSTVEYSMSTV